MKQYSDPSIDQLYDELRNVKLKSLTPDETSETWELVKAVYKKEQKRRRNLLFIRSAVAVSAALVVGAFIYKRKSSMNKDSFIGGGI